MYLEASTYLWLFSIVIMRCESYSAPHNIGFAGFQHVAIEGYIDMTYHTSAWLLAHVALLKLAASVRECRAHDLVSPEDSCHNHEPC